MALLFHKSTRLLFLINLFLEISLAFQHSNTRRPKIPVLSQIYLHSSRLVSHTSPFQQRQRPTTQLNLLLDVPDGFFAVTFPMLGLLLSLSKTFVRARMEEIAWEQRLEEARKLQLRQDSTLTESELRRQEAALEWSAYGKPRQEREELQRSKKRRVQVMERERYDDDSESRRSNRMSEEDIEALEEEFGIAYDPYYDDPYTEDELPEGKYTVDKRYGDRVYQDGEIFYKDKSTGLFYRQGAKPRNLSFF